MTKLEWSLKKLHHADRSGSFTTRADRQVILRGMSRTLKAEGFRGLHANSLKPKHVEALVNHWKTEKSARTGKPVSTATIKNRMSVLRWWAKSVGKPNVVPCSNDSLDIPRRSYTVNASKAVTLQQAHLDRVSCPYIKLGLQLQAEFGLRREEALKIRPAVADKGNHLLLVGSWCKGGRPRSIPIRTEEQRALVDAAKRFVGDRSLIPAELSYAQQLHRWNYQTKTAGLPRTHGLRHAYAQRRYRDETKTKAPAAAGPRRRELSEFGKSVDRLARRKIAEELGHSRIEITNNYLGR